VVIAHQDATDTAPKSHQIPKLILGGRSAEPTAPASAPARRAEDKVSA
jgi:hypothetical protein